MRALLADVGPTRVDAKAFDVARRPVRHVAPPPHQDCRPRRRDEDHDPGALPNLIAPLRISYASLSDAYRASSHDRRGMRPQTFTHVPSTRKPLSLDSGSRPEPTSRGQTYSKFKKITQTQPSRARTRQRAALSGLIALRIILTIRVFKEIVSRVSCITSI